MAGMHKVLGLNPSNTKNKTIIVFYGEYPPGWEANASCYPWL